MFKIYIFGNGLINVTILLFLLIGVETSKREYFVAIEEIVWDYTPVSTKFIKPIYSTRGADRIGLKYKKAIYREYTDRSFTTKSYRHPSLGLYGPILKAEVQDTIVVHALNRASRKYSFHPHGVFYLKSSEGALYNDNTTRKDKEDDGIPPGGSYTYVWEVRHEYGPGPEDPNCLTWAYHSHVDSNRDTNSGLIGTLLTCKQGILTPKGHRTDVDREFALIVSRIDENQSWYIDENIATFALEPGSEDKSDPKFIESNLMYSVNGRIMLNLPGLEMCKGDLVSWHMIGMGVSTHAITFMSQTVTLDHHRLDTVTLSPATFATVLMRADNPGSWTVKCQVTTDAAGGMVASMKITDKCGPLLVNGLERDEQGMDGIERTYYLGIEEVEWNYAPTGTNQATRLPLDEPGENSARYYARGPNRVGAVYKKAVFRRYTNDTFTEMVPQDPTDGIMGPLISGEVGDIIRVILKNGASRRYNIVPGGVFFSNKKIVEPGKVETYVWSIPHNVAPTEKDDNCLAYVYASTADVEKDQHSGLVGPMIVCKKGMLVKSMERKAYNILLISFDENLSHYMQENIDKYTTDPATVDKNDPDFIESNIMRAMNGFAFGNLFGIEMCVGEDTDFRVFAIGKQLDTHAFFVIGTTIRYREEFTGVIGVNPHTTATVTVSPYAPGRTIISCHVLSHASNGMFSFYRAKVCSETFEEWIPTGEKTFYVGLVEEIWDYLPERVDHLGKSVDDPNHYAFQGARQDGKYIGTKYLKAIYYEYTNETFTERKPKSEHLGFLGPVLRAEVGDVVKIHFKNMATKPYAMQPTGVYMDGIMRGPIPAAKQGETIIYRWEIRTENAPRENQPDCIGHMYTSYKSLLRDGYSGTFGPLQVCRRGRINMADEDFHLFFSILDENLSHYIDDNIQQFSGVDLETFDKNDPDFLESNRIMHINGRMYHLPGLNMKRGDLVSWHISTMGEEVHSIHFHANSLKQQSDKETRDDVFDVVAGQEMTILMQPDAVGDWLLHCHVNTHVTTGMVTTYRVTDAKAICRVKCFDDCSSESSLDCSILGIQKYSDLIDESNLIKVRKGGDPIHVPANTVFYLDLSNNHALGNTESLIALLAYFPSLHTLWLNDLNLMKLPSDLFINNPQLQVVHLRENHIRALPLALTNNGIKILDLRRNDISSIPQDIQIGGRHGLRRLDLRENRLIPLCLNSVHVTARSINCFQ